MLLEGKFVLRAPIQELWDFLLKPETLAACIPGCEQMDAIDENTFESIVVAKVGFIKVRFKFTTNIIEKEPPKHLKAAGKGEDLSKQGNFSQETVVDLRELANGEVEVSYKSNIRVVGKLATFGDRIMRAKAKQLEEEFTKNLRSKLSGK